MTTETSDTSPELDAMSWKLTQLSIVVPIYGLKENQENILKWLGNPLLKSCEKILVHDASDAESSEDFRKRITVYERIKFHEELCNSPGASRNLGLEYATGNWIVFWDADDEPNVEEFCKFFGEFVYSNKDVGVGSYDVINSNQQIITTRSLCRHLINDKNWELMRNPGIWSWIFQRSSIGEIRFQTSKKGEDQIFLVELDVFNLSLFKSERIVYRYRLGRANQITSNPIHHDELLKSAKLLLRLAQSSKSQTRFYALTACVYSYMVWIRNDIAFFGLVANIYRRLKATVLLITVCCLFPKAVFHALKHRLRQEFHAEDLSVFLAGGLGNQLFQLSYALSVPTVKNVELVNANKSLLELIFKEDFMREINRSNRYLSISTRKCSLFEKKLNNFFLRDTSRSFSYQKRFRYHLFNYILKTFYLLRFQRNIKLVNPINIGFGKEVLPSCGFSSLHAIGYFQSFVWANSIRGALGAALNKCISKELCVENAPDVNERKQLQLAIQIRLGDYLQKENAKIGRVGLDYLVESLKEIQQSSQVVVNVFSDNPKLAENLLSNMEGYSFKIVPPKLNALDNLYLMSCMDVLIISNSTFGWWGAYLASQRSEVSVIVPDPWFKEIDDPHLLIPEEWLRRDAFFYTS